MVRTLTSQEVLEAKDFTLSYFSHFFDSVVNFSSYFESYSYIFYFLVFSIFFAYLKPIAKKSNKKNLFKFLGRISSHFFTAFRFSIYFSFYKIAYDFEVSSKSDNSHFIPYFHLLEKFILDYKYVIIPIASLVIILEITYLLLFFLNTEKSKNVLKSSSDGSRALFTIASIISIVAFFSLYYYNGCKNWETNYLDVYIKQLPTQTVKVNVDKINFRNNSSNTEPNDGKFSVSYQRLDTLETASGRYYIITSDSDVSYITFKVLDADFGKMNFVDTVYHKGLLFQPTLYIKKDFALRP